MFAKAKPQTNSSNKFVKQIRENAQCNRNFETAGSKFLQNPTQCQLKQTKLNFSGAENATKKLKFNLEKNLPKTEFILMPLPNKAKIAVQQQQKQLNEAATTTTTTTTAAAMTNSMPADALLGESEVGNKSTQFYKNERNMICVIGRVDFCLKMHKLQPNLDALWDIYGILLRIIEGKQRQEFILLLRNGNTGPILQSIYYDFEEILLKFKTGCYLRVVGKFMGEYRLKTFKVEIIGQNVWQQNFKRIQNVISFTLLQNNLKK